MKLGNRIRNILFKTKVSYQNRLDFSDFCLMILVRTNFIKCFWSARTWRFLLNDSGPSELKYNWLKAKLFLCMCGKYDSPSRIIFCKELEWKRFTRILNPENFDTSFIALIKWNNDRSIMALVFFLKQNSAFLGFCDNWSADVVY